MEWQSGWKKWGKWKRWRRGWRRWDEGCKKGERVKEVTEEGWRGWRVKKRWKRRWRSWRQHTNTTKTLMLTGLVEGEQWKRGNKTQEVKGGWVNGRMGEVRRRGGGRGEWRCGRGRGYPQHNQQRFHFQKSTNSRLQGQHCKLCTQKTSAYRGWRESMDPKVILYETWLCW